MHIDTYERAGIKASQRFAPGGLVNPRIKLLDDKAFQRMMQQTKMASIAAYRFNVAASTATHSFVSIGPFTA